LNWNIKKINAAWHAIYLRSIPLSRVDKKIWTFSSPILSHLWHTL
jgi:hypothetical protein